MSSATPRAPSTTASKRAPSTSSKKAPSVSATTAASSGTTNNKPRGVSAKAPPSATSAPAATGGGKRTATGTAARHSPKVAARGASIISNANAASTPKKRASSAHGSATPKRRSTAAGVADLDASCLSGSTPRGSSSSSKKKNAGPVGNFYAPTHNLSFASNPFGNKSSKSARTSVAAGGTFSSPEDAAMLSSNTNTNNNNNNNNSFGRASSPSEAYAMSLLISPTSTAQDFSLSDPRTIFSLSPSRVAASYERDRINFETALQQQHQSQSHSAASPPTTATNNASEVPAMAAFTGPTDSTASAAPDLLDQTSPSMPLPDKNNTDDNTKSNGCGGGGFGRSDSYGDEETTATAPTAAAEDAYAGPPPPVYVAAPKFKSYFFGHEKPHQMSAVVAADGGEEVPRSTNTPRGEGRGGDAGREGSPMPHSPKSVTFGSGVGNGGGENPATAAAPSDAGHEDHPNDATAGEEEGQEGEEGAADRSAASPSMSSYTSPAGSASPNHGGYGSGSSASPASAVYGLIGGRRRVKSRALSGSSSVGSGNNDSATPATPLRSGSTNKGSSVGSTASHGRKGLLLKANKGGKKAGGKKSKKKGADAVVDPEDCRPPGPIERLFGDIAKSGTTGAPTLASMAIAARRSTTACTADDELKEEGGEGEGEEGGVSALRPQGVTPLQTAKAIFNLGWMHYHGLGGCGVNYKKAYAYFYEAATRYDHPMAHYYLGLQLREGKGTERNLLAAHDAFQTSVALLGKGAVSDVPPEDERANFPIKVLTLPTAAAAATAEAEKKEEAEGAAEEAPAPAAPAQPMAVINQSNKSNRAATATAAAANAFSYEGVDGDRMETVVSWQLGKMWATGKIVVLEEAPVDEQPPPTVLGNTAQGKKKPSVAPLSSAPARGTSPSPSTPLRGGSIAAGRSASVATNANAKARLGSVAGTGARPKLPGTANNNNNNTKAKRAASSPAGTKRRASSTGKKRASSKAHAAATKADATNNNGGGPNVVIKRRTGPFSTSSPSAATTPIATPGPSSAHIDPFAGFGEPKAAEDLHNNNSNNSNHLANNNNTTAAAVRTAIHYKKVRYAADKPVAVSLFERAVDGGFEHAVLAAEILRDLPIPKAELEEASA